MDSNHIVIMGGGLAGLSAGVALARAGRNVAVLEGHSEVGGLARTVRHGPFRFDLGGHRFHTRNRKVEAFVQDLMGPELVTVPRTSKILLRGRTFDYPLKPLNALLGLGIPMAVRIFSDYILERFKHRLWPSEIVSLEDWVVSRFGRTMFDLYFREYSEKVWGIPCDRICQEWVDQRINGLSLGQAVRHALFGTGGKEKPTLVERFLYPSMGIGRVADRLKEEIETGNAVLTDAPVTRVEHDGTRIRRVVASVGGAPRAFEADRVVSTIPVPSLVRMLAPRPPDGVLQAASQLRFRDLLLVVVMVNRPRATDQTWIYIPERGVPFGRIHEPTNWSARMAPQGQTLLVTEHFCFRSDPIWRMDDGSLVNLTVAHLEKLGFIRRDEVLDAVVTRIPKAYPLFEVGHRAHLGEILDYLGSFENLHMAGRNGMFRYLNMDHAVASGMEAAESILQSASSAQGAASEEPALAGVGP